MECDFQCTGVANEAVEKEWGNVHKQVTLFTFLISQEWEKNIFHAVCISYQLASQKVSWLYSDVFLVLVCVCVCVRCGIFGGNDIYLT